MAARIGSDEFVVVLDELRHHMDILAIADRLLGELSESLGMGHAPKVDAGSGR